LDFSDQLKVVHQVASQYWLQNPNQVESALMKIEVVKRTGGKVDGFFPTYQDFPSVFFKVYFYERGYRFETAGLKAAAAMPVVEGVRVPSVIAVMPEYKAILMEKRTWGDTSSPWKRLWVNRLGIDWFKVGKWLRAFHDTQTTFERNDYFLRKKYEKFESHLNDLKHLFTPAQVEKMNLIYASARDYFEKNECEWVISHGDFGLDNIKKSGSMLEIIDFEDCQSAPREFDILNCLTRLEYIERFPSGMSSSQKITERFLDGYSLMAPNSEGYSFLYLLIKLDMLETYHRRSNERSGSWQRKAIFKHFQRTSLASISHFVNSLSE
jgi:hypothetical protein